MKKNFFVGIFIAITCWISLGAVEIERVDPPFW